MKGLLVASRKTGVGVNAQETEYMVMYREQNARKNPFKSVAKSSDTCEKLGQHRNCIHEEIKSAMISGKACCLSFHNISSSRSLSKKYKNTENYNFVCCFVWVWNLVSHIEGGT
jgi:hypothetical protein